MTPRSVIPVLALVASLASACDREAPSPSQATSSSPAGHGGSQDWLRGTVDDRFALVSKHLRGFDMAMVEVGYRYIELYWAGRDRNWGYAEYQLRKIETAVANGVERRPARAASARMLDGAVSTVRTAIELGDGPAMDAALTTLTATCNACHQAEHVPFMTVAPPPVRLSPVQFNVAIVSTKIPILLGHGFWGFSLKSLSSYGFFSMAHESRTDFAMLLGSVFLLVVGSGPWAYDRRLAQRLGG
jgi:hypothetical protein